MDVKKSKAFELAPAVHEICTPFFKQTNINYFDYAKAYKTGELCTLVSDNAWLEHYFQRQFPISSEVVTNGVYLWQDYMLEDCNREAKEVFNHDFGITIVKEYDNYFEFYDFCTHANNSDIFKLYFNQTELLEQFFFYFKEKAEGLIKQVKKHSIILENQSINDGLKSAQQKQIDLLQEFSPKHYRLAHQNGSVVISRAEMRCLSLLAAGYSQKEVAAILNRSARTVESHIANVKLKSQLNTTAEMLGLVRKNFVTPLLAKYKL